MWFPLLKLITTLSNVAWTVSTEWLWWRMGVVETKAELVRRVCISLTQQNVLFVKLFQAICLNRDLWPDSDVTREVLRFTDQPPYELAEIDWDTLDRLRREFGVDRTGSRLPINAGMISLVFEGVHQATGEAVIIKLKRRHIDRRLAEGMQQIQAGLWLLEWIPVLRKMQLANLVRKNMHTVLQQTRFLEELRHTEMFGRNFSRIKYVRIPRVFPEITTALPHVLVLERLHGLTLAKLPPDQYTEYAKLVLKFSFATSMLHSVSHGDLHAGNLLFLRDPVTQAPVLGVIDFGIVYHLSDTYKQMLFDVFSNVVERTARQTAQRLLESNYLEPPGIVRQLPLADYQRLLDFTEQLIDECVHRRNGHTQVQMFAFVSQLSAMLQRPQVAALGIRMSDEFVQTQMMLAMSHGVAHTLTHGDLMPAVNAAMEDLFHLSWMLDLEEGKEGKEEIGKEEQEQEEKEENEVAEGSK